MGLVAAGREDKKVDKYSNLSDYYHCVPVGIETYGDYVPQGIKLVKQIGKKIQDATGEKLSTFYLFQSISIAKKTFQHMIMIAMQILKIY